jgi:hypothetical protein
MLTASEVLHQIATRRIGLTCCLDGKLWVASVDIKGNGVATKKRVVQSVSAIASTPIQAVCDLVAKLDASGINQQEERPFLTRAEAEKRYSANPNAEEGHYTEIRW